jgi:DNA/RNA-binding domain of Phe-tRNA-synthetase-like protein
MKTYRIANDIFAKQPQYHRGLVFITGLDNTRSSAALEAMLRESENSLADKFTLEQLLADPNVMSWREALRSFGLNPGEYRPAHEAMARRAVAKKSLPYINTAVAIGNMLSLKHLTPVGVHPVDAVQGDLRLKLAQGIEPFVSFGSDKVETVKRGEPIFADANDVLARGWVWRQAQCSITLPTTQSVVVHVDVLPPKTRQDAEAICKEVAALFQEYCSGQSKTVILDQGAPVTH